jgi:hypothetical protein
MARADNQELVRDQHCKTVTVEEMRCGFVYETGALAYRGRGNHIHLPPDSRVIHAPEYPEFFEDMRVGFERKKLKL